LVFHQDGEKYPKKTQLVGKYPIPCAGNFSDYEEQFDAWLTLKRCAIHLRRNVPCPSRSGEESQRRDLRFGRRSSQVV